MNGSNMTSLDLRAQSPEEEEEEEEKNREPAETVR